MNKEQNCCLLNAVFQGANTGLSTLEYLRPKVKSADLAEDFGKIKAEYKEIAKSADTLSRDCGGAPKDVNVLKKAGLWANMKLNTLKDNTSQHIAELILFNNFMGMIDMIKIISEKPLAEQDSINLAKRLKDTEEKSIETFMPYLEKTKL